MKEIVHALICVVMFFGLVLNSVYWVYWYEPILVFLSAVSFVMGFVLPFNTPLKVWCKQYWLWLDQGWNVCHAPILNFLLRPYKNHMFGNADETASSVVGKNYGKNLAFLWVDKVLSFFDPMEGSHGRNSIERDEVLRF